MKNVNVLFVMKHVFVIKCNVLMDVFIIYVIMIINYNYK